MAVIRTSLSSLAPGAVAGPSSVAERTQSQAHTLAAQAEERALVFAFDYPPLPGGIARLCSEVARRFKRHGISAEVLTQGAGEDRSSCAREFRMTPSRPAREWRALRWLRRNARNVPAICALWYPEGLLAWMAGARPRVILAHGAELLPVPSRLRRPLWRRLQRRVLESADVVVANSAYTASLVSEAAPRARVESVPPGVDHERFSPGDREAAKGRLGLDGKTVLSTVSRIHRFKGHDTVLRAIAELSVEERSNLVYLIAGRGPDERELNVLAEELGIASSVRWLGLVAEADLPDLYRASDLFVLCTREASRAVEGFGLVYLEAQACGIPVVGTRIGGIREAIREGEGGWLIDAGDAKTLAGIIRQAIADPESARAMGRLGRERVLREATWDHYMQRFISVLRETGALHD